MDADDPRVVVVTTPQAYTPGLLGTDPGFVVPKPLYVRRHCDRGHASTHMPPEGGV